MDPDRDAVKWCEIGQAPAAALREARLQAHWGIQLVMAAGDACLKPSPDDSHTNMGWSAAQGALIGHALPNGVHAGLRLTDLTLVLLDADFQLKDELALDSRRLRDGLEWLHARIEAVCGAAPPSLSLRDYDMPGHAVSGGGVFKLPSRAALAELAAWYHNADAVLHAELCEESHATPVRCWPHHFDIGALILLDPHLDPETGRIIGVGLSPGDDIFDEPYFYVNSYPRPVDPQLPPLPGGGQWHTANWFGAVLRSAEIGREPADDQKRVVRDFLHDAIAANRTLMKT